MKTILGFWLFFLMICSPINEAIAHSGGLDANGCHHDRQRGGFHCHTGSDLGEQQTEIFGRSTVIDGDTIEIRGVRIRLHGIDAPESSQICMHGDQKVRCGAEAANNLDRFIGATNVTCEQLGTDRYGRVIARCFANGVDLGSWMVRNGWAIAYRKYSDEYIDDELNAKSNLVGIWKYNFENPEKYRHRK
ncbi:thermonuclease family protein [Pseudomonadota bacterium]